MVSLRTVTGAALGAPAINDRNHLMQVYGVHERTSEGNKKVLEISYRHTHTHTPPSYGELPSTGELAFEVVGPEKELVEFQ